MRLFQLLFSALLASSMEAGEVEKKMSVDELKTLKFTFHIFENRQATTEVYKQEALLMEKLKLLRQELTNQAEIIQDFLKTKNGPGTFQAKAQEFAEFLNKTSTEVESMTTEFPNKVDFQGAKHGLTLLHYTYYMNLTAICLDKKLQFHVQDQVYSFPTYEKLTLGDLELMVKTAIERNQYSTAIRVMQELIPLLDMLNPNEHEDKGMRKRIATYKKDLVRINNGYLEKTHSFIDNTFEVLPMEIDKNLNVKKKQPPYVANRKTFSITKSTPTAMNWIFLSICQRGRFLSPPQPNRFCRLLHHNDPYLKLGPFKEDHISAQPYSVIFRDILSDIEMNYLKEQSKPNLTRSRSNLAGDRPQQEANSADFKSGKKRRIIHKTVQAWLTDALWPDTSFTMKPEKMPYVGTNYIDIPHPILWKLAKKIQLATQFRTDSQWSATEMQVTDYGLGGLCETHIDPLGIMDGVDVPPERMKVWNTGDMIGTFMAWLDNVDGGGGTAYVQPGYEGLIMPEKGSAAFWYDLQSDGMRDHKTTHGGCPVIKGSKWILNKWMHMYDNFLKFPCQLTPMTPFNPPNESHYFLP